MDAEERATRRAAIQALQRKPRSASEIRESARLSRKICTQTVLFVCHTYKCRTFTTGYFCTLCSSIQTSIEPEAYEEMNNFQNKPESDDVAYARRVAAAEALNNLPNNRGPQISPVGFAVVCLMIVFSLVAAYLQKHEEATRAEHVLIAD